MLHGVERILSSSHEFLCDECQVKYEKPYSDYRAEGYCECCDYYGFNQVRIIRNFDFLISVLIILVLILISAMFYTIINYTGN